MVVKTVFGRNYDLLIWEQHGKSELFSAQAAAGTSMAPACPASSDSCQRRGCADVGIPCHSLALASGALGFGV